MDVTNSASVRRAAEAAVARFGKIDVVVNNAGYGLMGAIEELDAPELEDVFKTNFFGVQRVLRVFLPILRAQRAGWIVNISSKAWRQHYLLGNLSAAEAGVASFHLDDRVDEFS